MGADNRIVRMTPTDPLESEKNTCIIPAGHIINNSGYNAEKIVWEITTVQTIVKQNQYITCPDYDWVTTNDNYVLLNCSATSGLPVEYSKINGPFTLSGDTVKLLGVPGNCYITAKQPGNLYYNAATEKAITITINIATLLTYNHKEEMGITINPTLTKGMVWISNTRGENILVYNHCGKLVYHYEPAGQQDNSRSTYRLNLQGMPDGLYLVKAGKEVVRIIKRQ
jgi:hypothetical protein